MIEFGLIIRALLRHKMAALILALQIALTLTVLVNAVFMIQDRQASMQRDSGVNEQDTFYLTSRVFAPDYDHLSEIPKDLDLLRHTPGITDAVYINSVPLSGYGGYLRLQLQPGKDQDTIIAGHYLSDDHVLNTLELELVAGENFQPEDVLVQDSNSARQPAKIIISQAMAAQLYPDNWQLALGAFVYVNETVPLRITGIVKTLQGAWHFWDQVEATAITPVISVSDSGIYLIRTEAGRRDELMPEVEALLAHSNKNRIIRSVTTLQDTRTESYREHNATNKILMLVIVTLVLVTAFGIVGLATFGINRRTRQIGTRRALGASKGQIMRYFMIENGLITLAGITLGCLGAVALNIYLVQTFAMTPVTPNLLLYGAISVFILGQLAVLYPARKAALISPATATRMV
ncbi:FtsX-like permease family protein [Thalassomonas viridans]|uniref:FtsX-like permease family protein n=1 Tax=Thalassomonas viridans TaxID=137584 RepID=A0AAE9Z6E4_9GAMM|nr:FtsX-like permease family protein [Thalassomonas viridans]WDE06859.1 FtsX-like permease family protein [Thalassomonas viridans]